MAEIFLIALMLFIAGSILLLGYGALIAVVAIRAAIAGRPVRPAIQPLLDEWSAS